MPLQLPDAVLQGLGLMPPYQGSVPPPVDQNLAGAPVDTQLVPPPPLPPTPAPVEVHDPVEPQLAPVPMEPQKPSVSTHPDYKVPISAFGDQQPSPKAPQPQRPLTPDQRFSAADAQQAQADQASQQANAATTQVKAAEANAQLGNYQVNNDEHARLQRELKAEQDAFAKTHLQKQAILDGFNKEVDSYKVDQNKYWNDLGLGDKVGLFVGMALGGLGNAFLGVNTPTLGAAENPVIKMLQDKMHQSIAAQMDQRDQLEKRAGRAEHALDRYDSFSKDRQAQILAREADADRSLARMVQMTAAKYAAPEAIANGQTIAAKLEQDSAQKQAEAAQRAAAYDTQKKQLAISGGHLALAAKADARAEREFNWKMDKEQQQLDLAAAKEAIVAQKAGGAEDQKLGVAASTASGTGMLTNKDGSVMHFRSPEIAQKTSDMIAGATAYNRLVGKMTKAIADHGGESTWVKGPEWQRMMSDLQSATAELHDAYGITSFREPTVEFFEKMATSGVDPTSFVRDASAALVNSNKNLQAKVNEKLTSAGYNGPKLEFAATDAQEAPAGPVQRIATLLKREPDQNPSRAQDDAFDATFRSIYDKNKGNVQEAKEAGIKAGIEAAQAARSGQISPAQRQGIEDLKAIAKAGGPDGQAAIDALTDLVQTEDAKYLARPAGPLAGVRYPWETKSSSRLRTLADQALTEIKNKGVAPTPPTESAGLVYDPNGYNVQSLINRFHAPYEKTIK